MARGAHAGKMNMRSFFSAALLLMGCTGVAQADTLRCKSSLVSTGMTATEIRKKCGEPDSKQTIVEEVRAPGASGTFKVGETSHEVWTYRRSSRSFPAVLTFDEEGRLKKIVFEN